MNLINKLERELEISIPSSYKGFIEHYPKGKIYYPKAKQADECCFNCFCNPKEDDEEKRWQWEPEEGTIGYVEVAFSEIEQVYSIHYFNQGSWPMKCICIGSLNDDLLIILDCQTEDVYCIEHDEVCLNFHSQQEYDEKMPMKHICFVDFTSCLRWCENGSIYNPDQATKQMAEKFQQRKKQYPQNIIYL